MAPTARLPPKKDVALALLEQASMYIHLDPRAGSVQVPPSFKNQPQLVLQVGLNMAVAIPDLHVDDDGLSCTLSFNRTPFFCMIPWPAVFALVGENGQAMVWAEDIPPEVEAQAKAQRAPEKPRTHLRSVGDGESAPPPAEKAEPAESKATSKGTKTAAKPAAGKTEAGKVTLKGGTKSKSEAKPAPTKAPKPTPKGAGKAASKPAKVPADTSKKAAGTPAPEPAAARQAVPAKKPAASKPESLGGTTEANKPKRELPPYLRVVK